VDRDTAVRTPFLAALIVRILFAGATGVLGRATLPYLRDAEVVALTRSRGKLDLLSGLGAVGVVCDVYDWQELLRVTRDAEPSILVNFVTDLRERSRAANNRARREGGRNLLRAAQAIHAERLVVESVAFPLEGEAAPAVRELEDCARSFAGEAVIVRFGRLWGPDTFHETPPHPPAVHVDDAGAKAAALILRGAAGIHEVS